VAIVGHVGQRVGADQVPAGQSPVTRLGPPPPRFPDGRRELCDPRGRDTRGCPRALRWELLLAAAWQMLKKFGVIISPGAARQQKAREKLHTAGRSRAGATWALLGNGNSLGMRQKPLVCVRNYGKQWDRDSPGLWGRAGGTGSAPGWGGTQGWRGLHLHDVVELQPRVWGGIYQDVGQGVLVVVHLICERGGKGW